MNILRVEYYNARLALSVINSIIKVLVIHISAGDCPFIYLFIGYQDDDDYDDENEGDYYSYDDDED